MKYEYKVLINKYDILYKSIEEFREKNIEIDKEIINKIEEELFDSIKKSYRNTKYNRDSQRMIKGECINYFSKILLIGKRYDFIKKEINEIETKPNFINEILSYIEKMDYQLFEYMNKELYSKEDSFITCMQNVFDSDTYVELLNKLNLIVNASKKYQEDPKEALKIIETLNTEEHKQKRNDIVLSWPKNNSINKIEKPKTILARTIALEKNFEFAPEIDDYMRFHSSFYSCRSISSFIDEVNRTFDRNKRKEEEEQERLEKEQQKEVEKTKTKKGLLSRFSTKE